MEGEHEYGPMSNIPSVGIGAAATLVVVELVNVELVGLEVGVHQAGVEGVRRGAGRRTLF